jgi:hypothetical protein
VFYRLANQRWKDTSIILRLKSNKRWGNTIAKNDRNCECRKRIDTEHLWICPVYEIEQPKKKETYDETTIKWAKRHKYFGAPLYKNDLTSIKANGGNPLKIRGGGNCKHCGKKFPDPQSNYGHVCPIKPNPNNRCGGCSNCYANMRLHKPRCRQGDLTGHGCGKTYGSLEGLAAPERQGKCTGSRSWLGGMEDFDRFGFCLIDYISFYFWRVGGGLGVFSLSTPPAGRGKNKLSLYLLYYSSTDPIKTEWMPQQSPINKPKRK